MMVEPAFADMLNPRLDVPRLPDLEFLPALPTDMQLPAATQTLGKPNLGIAGAGGLRDFNDLDEPFRFMDG